MNLREGGEVKVGLCFHCVTLRGRWRDGGELPQELSASTEIMQSWQNRL